MVAEAVEEVVLLVEAYGDVLMLVGSVVVDGAIPAHSRMEGVNGAYVNSQDRKLESINSQSNDSSL